MEGNRNLPGMERRQGLQTETTFSENEPCEGVADADREHRVIKVGFFFLNMRETSVCQCQWGDL